MCRAPVLIGAVLLAASAFAQQPNANPNPYPDTYNRDAYGRPVEIRTGYGNWGLLGLIGLAGLFGGRRRETIIRGREEFLNEPRNRAA
jgi:MYXO-CTERM domain-containing protein